MHVLLELVCHLHHLLSTLSCYPDVAEVMVVILEEDVAHLEEDVAHLEEVMIPMVADKLLAIRGPRQCKHCARNNHISEKCWEKFGCPEWAQLVMLILLPLVILSMFVLPQLLTLVLLALSLFYHKRSMIDCIGSSSLRTIIHRLMHLLQVCAKALDIRLRSLIPHDRY